jgi:hypothetical protein
MLAIARARMFVYAAAGDEQGCAVCSESMRSSVGIAAALVCESV